VLETLHLKLCVVAQTYRRVRDLVRSLQRPLLNLSIDSFRVQFVGTDGDLPFLWNSRVAHTDPGDAVVLPIATSDARYYFRARDPGLSIYRPETSSATRGRGTMRIRQVLDEKRRGMIVEGTYQPREDIAVDRHDLVWMRPAVSGKAVDLYAALEEDRALAFGEWRFRTVLQTLTDEQVAALREAEGVPLQNVPFEVFPLLSTPYDLYGLAVLGVKTLLVDQETTLAKAMDELISLAREAGAEGSDQPLSERIEELFSQDLRWSESLGPQRLVVAEMSAEEGFSYVPATVWWDLLSMLVRMLPAVGPYSTCRDYGDAPARALHDVFEQSLADVEKLVFLTRSLLVTDWQENREIHDVIAAFAPPAKAT
jgi:hypothetical protein